MSNAPECQPFVDAIANLTAQEQTQFAALAGLTGAAKWKAIEDLGTLRQQIADQQSLLNACEKQYGTDLTSTLVVMDVRGGAGGESRIGRIWRLTR